MLILSDFVFDESRCVDLCVAVVPLIALSMSDGDMHVKTARDGCVASYVTTWLPIWADVSQMVQLNQSY